SGVSSGKRQGSAGRKEVAMQTFVLRMVTGLILCTLGAGVGVVQAATPATADQLLQRAERALDLKEIERLQRAYGYYIDRSDWDNVLDLLTEDATAEYALSGVYVGKASIRRLLYGIGYGRLGLLPGQLREHTQLQPVITLSEDGRTARGR